MPFLNYLADIWHTAPIRILMRVVSLMRLRLAHNGIDHGQLSIEPPSEHSNQPPSTTTDAVRFPDAKAPPFPATPILGFRIASPGTPLPSLAGLGSLDITNSRDGAPMIPHPRAQGRYYTRGPRPLTPVITLLPNTPDHHPSNATGSLNPETPSTASAHLPHRSAARRSLQPVIDNIGEDNRAEQPPAQSTPPFQKIPLTPAPQQRHHGDNRGPGNPALDGCVPSVIWDWICSLLLGRRRATGRERDLEAGEP